MRGGEGGRVRGDVEGLGNETCDLPANHENEGQGRRVARNVITTPLPEPISRQHKGLKKHTHTTLAKRYSLRYTNVKATFITLWISGIPSHFLMHLSIGKNLPQPHILFHSHWCTNAREMG